MLFLITHITGKYVVHIRTLLREGTSHDIKAHGCSVVIPTEWIESHISRENRSRDVVQNDSRSIAIGCEYRVPVIVIEIDKVKLASILAIIVKRFGLVK